MPTTRCGSGVFWGMRARRIARSRVSCCSGGIVYLGCRIRLSFRSTMVVLRYRAIARGALGLGCVGLCMLGFWGLGGGAERTYALCGRLTMLRCERVLEVELTSPLGARLRVARMQRWTILSGVSSTRWCFGRMLRVIRASAGLWGVYVRTTWPRR